MSNKFVVGNQVSFIHNGYPKKGKIIGKLPSNISAFQHKLANDADYRLSGLKGHHIYNKLAFLIEVPPSPSRKKPGLYARPADQLALTYLPD